MEYSQTRSAYLKILYIIYRFKKQDIYLFRTKRFKLTMRNYLLRDVIWRTYVNGYRHRKYNAFAVFLNDKPSRNLAKIINNFPLIDN
jgi:hypothetical protein